MEVNCTSSCACPSCHEHDHILDLRNTQRKNIQSCKFCRGEKPLHSDMTRTLREHQPAITDFLTSNLSELKRENVITLVVGEAWAVSLRVLLSYPLVSQTGSNGFLKPKPQTYLVGWVRLTNVFDLPNKPGLCKAAGSYEVTDVSHNCMAHTTEPSLFRLILAGSSKCQQH